MTYLRNSLVLLSLLFAFSAQAQPCSESVPLEKSSVAPCEGVLWPNAWTASAISCMTVDLKSCEGREADCEKILTVCQKSLSDLKVAHAVSEQRLADIARDAAGITRPWHENKWLMFSLGLAVGGGGALLLTNGL